MGGRVRGVQHGGCRTCPRALLRRQPVFQSANPHNACARSAHAHTCKTRLSCSRTHAPRDTPKYTGLAVSHTHILAHAHTHSRAHTHTLTEEHFFLLLLMPPKRNLSPAAFFPLPFLLESLEPLIFFLTPGPER